MGPFHPSVIQMLGGSKFRLRRGFACGENACTLQKRRGPEGPLCSSLTMVLSITNIGFNRPFQKRRTSVRCPSFCVSAARSVHRSFAQTKQPPPSLAVTFFLRKEQAGCLLPTPGRPHSKEEDTMKKTLSLAIYRIPDRYYKIQRKRLQEY